MSVYMLNATFFRRCLLSCVFEMTDISSHRAQDILEKKLPYTEGREKHALLSLAFIAKQVRSS
jgi:hypothetical protein